MNGSKSIEIKRRGRKTKNQKKEFVINEDQTKFFVDMSSDKDRLKLIFELLRRLNNKDYGREILFRDVCISGALSLSDKAIEKMQEGSMTEMERVERALAEHNKKSDISLSLGEFLIKKLGIN